jgi:transposase
MSYKDLSKEELVALHVQQEGKIVRLTEELAQLKKLIYGSKSERFVPEANTKQLILDLDIPSDKLEDASSQVSINYTRRQNKQNKTIQTGGRMALPADLPRVEIVIEPKEDVSGYKKIGEEITEELELEPARFIVNRYVRPKYARVNGEGVVIGELPSRPIDKGIPGPGFLATILTDKYMDHLPLYRQIKRYSRMGVELNDSTFSEWVQASCKLLSPLYDELKKQILSQKYIQADETPIKVLDQAKKGTSHRGYYWVYHCPHTKMVFFDYQPGRGREGPTEVLKDYKGFLQTDGYGVYDKFDTEDIRLIHCMAHARRMFDEALGNDKQRSESALVGIQELYKIESKAREEKMSYQQRQELRQQFSVPILLALKKWMQDNVTAVTPQSLIGKAIAYSLSRWDKLSLYAQHGELEIDNNLVENAIRPVALGRKNYLFAGSHKAAHRAGMIYSLLATCKYNGVDPYTWLKNVLQVLPDHKANELHLLLPQPQNVVQN